MPLILFFTFFATCFMTTQLSSNEVSNEKQHFTFKDEAQILAALNGVTESLMHFKIEVTQALMTFRKQVEELTNQAITLQNTVKKVDKMTDQQDTLGHSFAALLSQITKMDKKLTEIQSESKVKFSQLEYSRSELQLITAQLDSIYAQMQRLQKQIDRLNAL